MVGQQYLCYNFHERAEDLSPGLSENTIPPENSAVKG